MRKGSSKLQTSKLVGKTECFGRVECDAILLDNACVKSTPIIDAQSVDASLNHEATVGKIAGEQLIKLMSLIKSQFFPIVKIFHLTRSYNLLYNVKKDFGGNCLLIVIVTEKIAK